MTPFVAIIQWMGIQTSSPRQLRTDLSHDAIIRNGSLGNEVPALMPRRRNSAIWKIIFILICTGMDAMARCDGRNAAALPMNLLTARCCPDRYTSFDDGGKNLKEAS